MFRAFIEWVWLCWSSRPRRSRCECGRVWWYIGEPCGECGPCRQADTNACLERIAETVRFVGEE